jgi:protein-arginine kinase activator protein McsA
LFGTPKLVRLADSLALSFFFSSADLQKAIESENYALAAELRDAVTKLEVYQN